jgi:SAM-dependent methyltransferase
LKTLFDQPERYDEFLNKGIGITGNEKNYFIEGRLGLLLEKMKNRNPEHILDFGCGTGATSSFLQRLFPGSQIHATDYAEAAVAFAKTQNKSQSIYFQRFNEWKQSNERYDLVYINCVFHHIEPPERQAIMDLLYAKMKEEGEIWIFENNPLNPGTRLAMYLNPFDKGVKKIWPSELGRLTARSGFREKDKWFLFYFPQWLSVFRFLEKLLLKLPFGGQYAVQAEKG